MAAESTMLGVSTAALVAELKRRYVAFLFAGVRVDGRNEAVADEEQKGCWELLKYLHAKQECHLEVQLREDVKLWSGKLNRTLAGNADGEVTLPE
jgi:hypothetical protein